ncbi:MAG: DUF711 family protein [Candidatus Aerophobetes bacterium]|nr:DUF711 family protein [Candidatus Aerophobetes bacterium]
MKIRTITTGLNLDFPGKKKVIEQAAKFSREAKREFEDKSIEVQSLRICTQPWVDYLRGKSKNIILKTLKEIEDRCASESIAFLSIGSIFPDEDKLSYIDLIPEINMITSNLFSSVTIATQKRGISFKAIKKTAKVIKRISEVSEEGYGNLRFAALAHCPSNIPFFPAAYHSGKEISFAIGLEGAGLVRKAFEDVDNLEEAGCELKNVFQKKVSLIEETAKDIEKRKKVKFKGIDVSPAPSLNEEGSIAYTFEKLGFGKFGSPATLSISSIITGVLKNLKIKRCGYSGLMLPVLEDIGLAKRNDEGLFNIDTLLVYSAVCGTGLDMIPIPGNTPLEKIEAILLDVSSLALKLNKPLSARLLPIPNKRAGEKTNFNSPYLVNCKIMKVK